MILYEYRCVRCGALFAVRRPMTCRNLPAACPECGATGRRVISVPQAHKGIWQEPTDPETLRTTPEIWD